MAEQTARIESATLERMFEVAIALEKRAESLYSGFAERFAHCAQAARFWRRYAADEVMHRSYLTRLHNSLTPDKLAKPIEVTLIEAGEALLRIPVEECMAEIANLDDAHELSHELESSETNAIFRFLIAEFSDDRRIITHLMDDLERHVEALSAQFPAAYMDRARRQTIEPLP